MVCVVCAFAARRVTFFADDPNCCVFGHSDDAWHSLEKNKISICLVIFLLIVTIAAYSIPIRGPFGQSRLFLPSRPPGVSSLFPRECCMAVP